MNVEQHHVLSPPKPGRIFLFWVVTGIIYGALAGICFAVFLDGVSQTSRGFSKTMLNLEHWPRRSLQFDLIYGSEVGFFFGIVAGGVQGLLLAAYSRVLKSIISDYTRLLRQCRFVSVSLMTLLLSPVVVMIAVIFSLPEIIFFCLVALLATWFAAGQFARWFVRQSLCQAKDGDRPL